MAPTKWSRQLFYTENVLNGACLLDPTKTDTADRVSKITIGNVYYFTAVRHTVSLDRRKRTVVSQTNRFMLMIAKYNMLGYKGLVGWM